MEIYKRGIFVYIDLTEIVIVIVFRVNRHWVIRIFKRSLYGVTLCKKRKKEQWKLLKPEFIRKISEFDCSENVFFFFFTDTEVFQDSRGPSFITLYHFHPPTNIETFICNFACEMAVTYF